MFLFAVQVVFSCKEGAGKSAAVVKTPGSAGLPGEKRARIIY